jgi:hypothetical protein
MAGPTIHGESNAKQSAPIQSRGQFRCDFVTGLRIPAGSSDAIRDRGYSKSSKFSANSNVTSDSVCYFSLTLVIFMPGGFHRAYVIEIFSPHVAVPYSIGSSASRRLRLGVCSRSGLPVALWRRKTIQAVMILPSTEYRLY